MRTNRSRITWALIVAALFTGCCCPPAGQQTDPPLVLYAVKSDARADTAVKLETRFGLESNVHVDHLIGLAAPAYKTHSESALPTCYPKYHPLTSYEIFTDDSVSFVDTLEDQFTVGRYDVHQAKHLLVPVDSLAVGSGLWEAGQQYPSHLKLYYLKGEDLPQPVTIYTIDRFGKQKLAIQQPEWLAEPALKNESGQIPNRKPLVCYRVLDDSLNVNIKVRIVDQFGDARMVVLHPVLFCDPVISID